MQMVTATQGPSIAVGLPTESMHEKQSLSKKKKKTASIEALQSKKTQEGQDKKKS